MFHSRRVAFLAALLLISAACAGPGAPTSRPGTPATSSAPSRAPTTVPTTAPTTAPATASPAANIPNVVCVGEATTYFDWLNGDFQPDDPDPIPSPAATEGDLLETVRASGKLRISVDKDYAPQSFLKPDGSFVGFDVDVGKEIAKRIGVEAEFQHQDWDLITAGNWAGRWDISVGSMTITTPRKAILSFTQPYYYTPAFMAASTRSGITSIDQLPFDLPEGAEVTTLPTDANCIEAIAAGRPEFDLVITSGTVIDEAIQNDQPVVKIEQPGFVEDLAVAIDKSGPPHAALLYEINKAIGDMHADGTLTALSEEWFEGEDLTQPPAE